MKIGIVYYADDPQKRVFRVVYPGKGESEAVLHGPATDVHGVMRDEAGNPHGWHTFGVDSKRTAVLEIVEHDDPRTKLTGSV